jgi:hypothetical protein
MQGGEKMKKYDYIQNIENKVDKLLLEKSEKKKHKNNRKMKTYKEYKSEMEKISKQLMKYQAKNRKYRSRKRNTYTAYPKYNNVQFCMIL